MEINFVQASFRTNFGTIEVFIHVAMKARTLYEPKTFVVAIFIYSTNHVMDDFSLGD